MEWAFSAHPFHLRPCYWCSPYMSSRIPYIQLASASSPTSELSPVDQEEINDHNGGFTVYSRPSWSRNIPRKSEVTAWKVFIASCVISLALSATNLVILSWVSAPMGHRGYWHDDGTQLEALKHPSVYIGLDNVVYDRQYCRSRGTYPKSFAIYDVDEGMYAKLQRVHAPDDRMTLEFGGPVGRPHIHPHLQICSSSLCRALVHFRHATGPRRC